MEIALKFASLACDACGEPRHACRPCEQCGAAPVPDPLVSSRQLLTQPARLLLDRPVQPATVPSVPSSHPSSWIETLCSWPRGFLEAIERASLGEEVEGGLETAVGQLMDMRDRVAEVPRYRPYISAWRQVDALARHLIEAARLYLDALGAESPEDASVLGARAQQAIDLAAAILEAHQSNADAWDHVTETALHDVRLGPIVGIVRLAAGYRASLVGLDAAATYADIVGHDEPGDAFITELVRLQLVQIASIGDVRRMVEVARDAYATFIAHPDRLKTLLQSPEWCTAYEELNRELLEAGAETRRLLPDFHRPVSAGRSLIRLGHVLAERCALPLAAALYSLRSGKPLSQTLSKDIGALLGLMRQAGLSSLFFGLDKALRNADAHADFKIGDEGVEFTCSSREYDALTWPQLFDRVIGGFESILAINLGLFVAAARVGVVLDVLHALGLTLEEKCRVVFSLGGLDTKTVGAEGNMLSGELTGDQEPRLAFLSMLVPHLPQEIDALTLAVSVNGRTRMWQADVVALRRWAAEDDPAVKHALFCGAVAAIVRDDVPAFSRNVVRKAASVAVGVRNEASAAPSAETAKSARAFAEIALRLGDSDLHRCMVQIAQRAFDSTADVSLHPDHAAAVDQVRIWASQQVSTVPFIDGGSADE